MLSICIPVYNFDITGLLVKLNREISKLAVPAEIICIDDCSSDFFKEKNKPGCDQYSTYIPLPFNVGRAKIRNLFTEYAKYEYLLFLDCDVVIFSDDFLSRYIKAISDEKPLVICGGRIYDHKRPARKGLLQWRYGRAKESLDFSIRQLHPHRSFMTNNFLIHRSVLSRVCFDERLVNYGHEDTLFGFCLKKGHIPIKHINNPVLNGDLEVNAGFIFKTELGLQNLICILSYLDCDPEYMNDVTILSFYGKCRQYHLTGMIVAGFSLLKPWLRYFLTTGYAPLFLLDFYKLGFFAKKYRKSEKRTADREQNK